MKIKRPFMTIMLLNEVVKHPLLKPKFKFETFNDSIRLHNIHISDQAQLVMINMSLKWQHINICEKNC